MKGVLRLYFNCENDKCKDPWSHYRDVEFESNKARKIEHPICTGCKKVMQEGKSLTHEKVFI